MNKMTIDRAKIVFNALKGNLNSLVLRPLLLTKEGFKDLEAKIKIINSVNVENVKSLEDFKNLIFNGNDTRLEDLDTASPTCEGLGNQPVTLADGTHIIPIKGTLVDDFCAYENYFTGYPWIRNKIKKAINNKDVKKIILEINSPGGDWLGAVGTFNYIFENDKIKPIEAQAVNLCCSGAYLLASATRKITAADVGTMVGSIGVYTVFIDDTGMQEKYGVKEIVITDDTSPNKVPDPRTEEGLAVIKNNLNEIKRVFVEKVSARGRIKDIEATTKGDVFMADVALENGLIDEIKFYEKTILEGENIMDNQEIPENTPSNDGGKGAPENTSSNTTNSFGADYDALVTFGKNNPQFSTQVFEALEKKISLVEFMKGIKIPEQKTGASSSNAPPINTNNEKFGGDNKADTNKNVNNIINKINNKGG